MYYKTLFENLSVNFLIRFVLTKKDNELILRYKNMIQLKYGIKEHSYGQQFYGTSSLF
jgi:hypothetical protein